MWETNNITTGIGIKLNKSASLYHVIRGLVNTKQGEAEPNNAFKLHFESVYDTMELACGDNIPCKKQITKNGSQASMKEKQAQIYQMKAVCFLLSADQKRYGFLFKKLRGGENLGKGEYPVTTILTLYLFIFTEGGISGNKHSTRENCGGRGVRHQKGCMGHTFSQKRQGGKCDIRPC